MASRTSAGVGVYVTITFLGILCLTLFILTIVFLSRSQAAERDLRTANAEYAEFVRGDERQSDAIQRLKEIARRDGKSVVGFLNSSLRTSMSRVTGQPNDGVEQLQSKLAAVEGAQTNDLLSVVRGRESEIQRLQGSLAQADADRRRALEDLANESARVKQLVASHQATVDDLNRGLDRYKAEVDEYRAGVNQSRLEMDSRVEQVRNQAESERIALNDRISELQRENLIMREQVRERNLAVASSRLTPTDAYALVDGSVVGTTPARSEVNLSLGSRDKLVLGMTFSVYADGRAIRPDAQTGEYPRGKAMVEVISIEDNSSTARVLWEVKGNPIVKGDVVANPVYDPGKTYKFLVYGNFDANRDGRSTPAEAEEIKAMIGAWGGEVVDDLTGDVDFLVLGERPVLPPAPTLDTPDVLVREYMRLDALALRYDQLFERSVATSVPVLNQNRLFTLLGR